MDINKISSTGAAYSSDSPKKKSVEASETVSKTDKLEISKEAQSLNKPQNKNLEEIKNKIANKFYEQKEVLSKVADKILTEIKNK